MTQDNCLLCGLAVRIEARGLCIQCYHRLHKLGELETYPRRRRPGVALEEWISLIDRTDPDACWPWPGPRRGNGYGAAYGGPAHRVVYVRMIGPIPSGFTVDHACHNASACQGGDTCPHRLCVNWIRHLELVTPQVNVLRSPNTPAAINAAKTRCPQGHAFTDSNTYVHRRHRHCRACRRLSASEKRRAGRLLERRRA